MYFFSFSPISDVGAYAGLNFLRLAGYVHRDISPGNVLFVKNEKGALQIKISDLEYA